jgi:hypothetical protein
MPNQPLNWRRLYAAATLVGAGLGVLLVLGIIPKIPDRLAPWTRGVDHAVAMLMIVLGCAVVALALAAVAHLGVHWQLRRRSKAEPG